METFKKDCNVHYEAKLKYYPVLVIEFVGEIKTFPFVDNGMYGEHEFSIAVDYDAPNIVFDRYLFGAENKIREIQNWINETSPNNSFVDRFVEHIKSFYEGNHFDEPYHYIKSYFSIIHYEKTDKVELLRAWKFKIESEDNNNNGVQ